MKGDPREAGGSPRNLESIVVSVVSGKLPLVLKNTGGKV